MRTITKTLQAFKFEELSETAKQNAMSTNSYTNDEGWWEHVYSDAKEVAELIGFSIKKIYFSGFSSQGDGACFEGSMQYAKGSVAAIKKYRPTDKALHSIAEEWQKLQQQNFYKITGTVKQRGHYMHSGCTSFDWNDERTNYGYPSDSFDEGSFNQCIRNFMDWIYSQLEAQHDYLNSEEVFAESATANNWEFTEDGTMI